jgi:hypothetical protein
MHIWPEYAKVYVYSFFTDANLEDIKRRAAEDDVPSQLALGRHLLQKGDTLSDETGNLVLAEGVSWLIRASKHGDETATEELRKCLETHRGITDENVEDIRWCLETPNFEKSAREAARRLFRSLNHNQMRMTKDDFLEGIANLTMSKSERKLLQKAGEF